MFPTAQPFLSRPYGPDYDFELREQGRRLNEEQRRLELAFQEQKKSCDASNRISPPVAAPRTLFDFKELKDNKTPSSAVTLTPIPGSGQHVAQMISGISIPRSLQAITNGVGNVARGILSPLAFFGSSQPATPLPSAVAPAAIPGSGAQLGQIIQGVLGRGVAPVTPVAPVAPAPTPPTPIPGSLQAITNGVGNLARGFLGLSVAPVVPAPVMAPVAKEVPLIPTFSNEGAGKIARKEMEYLYALEQKNPQSSVVLPMLIMTREAILRTVNRPVNSKVYWYKKISHSPVSDSDLQKLQPQDWNVIQDYLWKGFVHAYAQQFAKPPPDYKTNELKRFVNQEWNYHTEWYRELQRLPIDNFPVMMMFKAMLHLYFAAESWTIDAELKNNVEFLLHTMKSVGDNFAENDLWAWRRCNYCYGYGKLLREFSQPYLQSIAYDIYQSYVTSKANPPIKTGGLYLPRRIPRLRIFVENRGKRVGGRLRKN